MHTFLHFLIFKPTTFPLSASILLYQKAAERPDTKSNHELAYLCQSILFVLAIRSLPTSLRVYLRL